MCHIVISLTLFLFLHEREKKWHRSIERNEMELLIAYHVNISFELLVLMRITWMHIMMTACDVSIIWRDHMSWAPRVDQHRMSIYCIHTICMHLMWIYIMCSARIWCEHVMGALISWQIMMWLFCSCCAMTKNICYWSCSVPLKLEAEYSTLTSI